MHYLQLVAILELAKPHQHQREIGAKQAAAKSAPPAKRAGGPGAGGGLPTLESRKGTKQPISAKNHVIVGLCDFLIDLPCRETAAPFFSS